MTDFAAVRLGSVLQAKQVRIDSIPHPSVPEQLDDADRQMSER